MADVLQAIRTLILQDEAIAARFGGRVHADQRPQAITALPAAVLWIVSEEPWNHLLGPCKIESARIQINTYARNRSESISERLAIRDQIAGFQGTVAGVIIRELSQASGGRADTDRPWEGTDDHGPYVSQDFFCTYLSGVN